MARFSHERRAQPKKAKAPEAEAALEAKPAPRPRPAKAGPVLVHKDCLVSFD
jgi:hypothetical protein